MAEWITPIIDRTSDDTGALDRNSAASQKGALNASDLNRIEGNYQYLMELLSTGSVYVPHRYRDYEERIVYANGEIHTEKYTDWHEHNTPWLSEIKRIRANHSALAKSFLRKIDLPTLMDDNYLDFEEVNNWENFVLVGKMVFEDMQKEYIYCGTINSGGERLL